jgi:hypothetical protein
VRQQLPKQSCNERAAELRRLDAVLTQIKAELPQITDPEIVEAVKLVRSRTMSVTILCFYGHPLICATTKPINLRE